MIEAISAISTGLAAALAGGVTLTALLPSSEPPLGSKAVMVCRPSVPAPAMTS
jgi:hypothetical protein